MLASFIVATFTTPSDEVPDRMAYRPSGESAIPSAPVPTSRLVPAGAAILPLGRMASAGSIRSAPAGRTPAGAEYMMRGVGRLPAPNKAAAKNAAAICLNDTGGCHYHRGSRGPCRLSGSYGRPAIRARAGRGGPAHRFGARPALARNRPAASNVRQHGHRAPLLLRPDRVVRRGARLARPQCRLSRFGRRSSRDGDERGASSARGAEPTKSTPSSSSPRPELPRPAWTRS